MKKRVAGLLSSKQIRLLREKIRNNLSLSIAVVAAATGLLCYKLTSLVPFGNTENSHAIGSANLSELKNDTLLAPVKALQLFILKITEDDAYIRLASVAAALSAAWLLFLMLRKWHTARVSLLTSLLFICSSWYLHAGRLASVDVLYLTVVPALLLIVMWFLSKKDDNKLPLAALLMGLLLYIPGAIVFVCIGLVLLRKYILQTIRKLDLRLKLVSGGIFLATIAPLVYSFALKPTQLAHWIGFDTQQSFSLSNVANNFLDIPRQLFVSGLDQPSRWLVGTPVFDVFLIAMLVLGIYAYRAGKYPAREKMIAIVSLVSILIIGFGQVATLGLLIPVLYILVANGIAYMLQSWFTVFPRNPVARPMGIILLSLVIAMSCFYQLHRYFVAWPQAEATKSSLISGR